jgi:hypothetical protein
MKYILFFLFIILFFKVNGQKKNLNCILIQFSIESNVFKTKFLICKSNLETHIIDKTNSFNNCILKDICNKNIDIHSDTSEIDKKTRIELFKIEKKKNVFILYFYRPTTGAALTLKLKYIKGKLKIIGYNEGAF